MDLRIGALRLAAKQYFRKCPRTKERLLALIELAKRAQSNEELTELDYEVVGTRFEKSGRGHYRYRKVQRE